MVDENTRAIDDLAPVTINIYVVIDTSLAAESAPWVDGGEEISSPIAPARGYLIVTGPQDVTNQGGAELSFSARAGEIVRFFVASGSNNFDSSVLLQSIQKVSGADLLEGLAGQMEERPGLAPASTTGVLPAAVVPDQQFWFWQAQVSAAGTGSYRLVVARYGRGDDGQPRFAGLHAFTAEITIRYTTASP